MSPDAQHFYYTFNAVCCWLIIVMQVSILIAMKLRKKSPTASESQRNSMDRQLNFTKMVMIVATFMLILFTIPITILAVAIWSNAGQSWQIPTELGQTIFIIICLNSSITLFIYMRMNAKIRVAVLHLFGVKVVSVKIAPGFTPPLRVGTAGKIGRNSNVECFDLTVGPI